MNRKDARANLSDHAQEHLYRDDMAGHIVLVLHGSAWARQPFADSDPRAERHDTIHRGGRPLSECKERSLRGSPLYRGLDGNNRSSWVISRLKYIALRRARAF